MIVLLLGILYFGLDPKDLHLSNQAHRLPSTVGIQFSDYALAYTDDVSPLVEKDFSGENGFSIEMALKPRSFDQEGFKFILALHAGNDRNQLLVAQWRSSIILMNGDDYNHKRRTKRLAVSTSLKQPVKQLITIATDKNGTRVYFDGRLVGNRKDLTLRMPRGNGAATRLTIANSVYGRHPWQGEVYGLAIYDTALSAKDAKDHHSAWAKSDHFSFAEPYDPVLLYYFDGVKERLIQDHSDLSYHLFLPQRLKVLAPEYFFQRFNEPNYSEKFFKDTVLNFIGFLPFGFVLGVFFTRIGGIFRANSVLFTLMVGFLISLFIETIQAWTPLRSSDMLDIILNTLGAMVGATVFRYTFNAMEPKGVRNVRS